MKKILCYKLKISDFEMLGLAVKRHDIFELQEIRTLEESRTPPVDTTSAIFYYIDESADLSIFEDILKANRSIPINVILKNKDFNFLMICYRYQVCSVFEKELDQVGLERVLVKIELLTCNDEGDIPTKEVLELFSLSAKIKTDREMYNRLAHYLSQFEDVLSFGLLKKGIKQCDEENANEEQYIDLIGGNISNENLSEIVLPRVTDNFIGQESIVQYRNKVYTASCILQSGTNELWIFVEIRSGKGNYILNKLFYKYLESIHIYRMNKEKEHNLEALASTDDVTGLYNQRKLSVDLERAVLFHEKQGKNFSIMFIDVDHFKAVNDNYGHVVGSKLLQDIGDVLSHVLRASDDIYRYGGDEFVVLMPLVNIQTVLEIATRVLINIKKTEFDIGKEEPYHLSVSIGIAEYPTDATSAIEIIRFADEMMYKSKKSGRGKVFHIKEV